MYSGTMSVLTAEQSRSLASISRESSMEFQAVTDGVRVIDSGRLIAHVTTRFHDGTYEKAVRTEAASGKDEISSHAVYKAMDRKDYEVRSAIGPLTVGQLEEILAGLK